jgi:hypothetical protein
MEDQVAEIPRGGPFTTGWSCPRCGNFFLDERLSLDPLLYGTLENNTQRAVLSHWIRTKYEAIVAGDSKEDPITLTHELVTRIIEGSPPSPAEQANKFILWLGSSRHQPGIPVPVKPSTHQSIVGAVTPHGFELVVYDLLDKGLLQGRKSTALGPVGQADVALSMDGWRYFEKLRRGAVDSRKAFMAMPYGKKELDGIVELVFRPAVKQAGFGLSRLDDPDQPAGLIDDRLRVAIQTSRFLIADLTHENRGAYWEAGYAEGLGKPVIYTCEEKKFEELQTHFDTNHHLTIRWDAEDPHKLEVTARKLKDTIRATLPVEARLKDD